MKKYKVWLPMVPEILRPEGIEQELNAYAEQGWRVVSCTDVQFYPGPNRFIVILEKDA